MLEGRLEGEEYQAQIIIDSFNQRVKLASFKGNLNKAARGMVSVAAENGAGKAIAYVKEADVNVLAKQNFRNEGKIPGFFSGEDAFCMVAYLEENRGVPRDKKRADEIVQLALTKKRNLYDYTLFTFREGTVEDHEVLADFYCSIFGESYPTPIADSQYLISQIKGNTVFQLVWEGDTLCGAASLEIDPVNRNAEVTDCAVLPDYRGKGLLAALVLQLECSAKVRGISCLYSLSRALLPGINAVLSSLDYGYYGRLINNCYICGGFEDMNIWQKFIRV